MWKKTCEELIEVAKKAFDWLSECEPGTHQAEIAAELKIAIKKAEKEQRKTLNSP